ncbi:hypothetical protein OGATHE_000925 [Ogataea polymorpha]|uniref:Methylated-DNA-[protein]-cysteine S-methyltransferase DNA binding domain-containing protein n=2 Tax=Ogataea polymorpha TaxID=460523 RepID=A0A9P8TGF0_9ASCO|nr:hypothetical protein OGATHE_000925 [Ogataea polymorpha]
MSLKNLTTYSRFFDDPEFQSLPWWRVVNSQGMISKRERADAVREQASLLRGEGVIVSERGGEYFVDLNKFGWFADASDDGESSDESDN